MHSITRNTLTAVCLFFMLLCFLVPIVAAFVVCHFWDGWARRSLISGGGIVITLFLIMFASIWCATQSFTLSIELAVVINIGGLAFVEGVVFCFFHRWTAALPASVGAISCYEFIYAILLKYMANEKVPHIQEYLINALPAKLVEMIFTKNTKGAGAGETVNDYQVSMYRDLNNPSTQMPRYQRVPTTPPEGDPLDSLV